MKPALTSILGLGLAWFVPEALAPAPEKPATNLQEYLSLTATQQRSLEQLQAQLRQKARASVQDLEQKQKAVRTQLASGDADPLTLGKLVISLELAKHRTEAASEEIRNLAMSQLTAAQRSKLQALESAKALQPVVREAMGMFLLAPPPELIRGSGPLGMFTAPHNRPVRQQHSRKDGLV